MTLILSLITPTYVMQASDRRVSTIDGLGHLHYAEDERNKAIMVAERFTFAYTGSAAIENDTATFIQSQFGLALRDGDTPEESLDHVAVMLNDQIVASSSLSKRFALAGVGWTGEPRMAIRRPLHLWASNATDEDGGWREDVATTFSVHRVELQPSQTHSLVALGSPMDPQARTRLEAQLAHLIEQSDDPDPAGRLLVEAIRDEASRNAAVGRGVMVNTLPITPGPHDQILIVAGPPKRDVRTFAYVAPDGFQSRLLSPLFVSSGGAELGPMIAEGPGIMGPDGGTTGIGYGVPGLPPPRSGKIGQRIRIDRPKRNEPCWCGSGRKYKKCHGP